MRFVVIGASAAGITAVQKLRECNPEAEITLISKDTQVYSRCILYHHLDQTRTLEEMNFAGLDFDSNLHIQWMKGTEAVSVDTIRKIVHTDQNTDVPYDRLCIATGSHSNFPSIPGLREGKNILGFRDLSDADKIMTFLKQAKNIFVMGAGLVGIDVITGLLPHKKNIWLADMGPYMLPIQLDEYAAGVYQKLFSEKGVVQYYGMGAREFVLNEEGNCCKVILQDNTELQVDLVINCTGVRANTEFLEGSGIAYDRFGLLIDEYGRTNVEDVYGAGDVTGRSPVWPVAVREGMTAAYAMSGKRKIKEEYFAQKSSMHFLDIPTVSIGKVNRYDESYQELVQKDDERYMKIVIKEGIVVGVLLQGDISKSGVLMKMISQKKPVSEVHKSLFELDSSDI